MLKDLRAKLAELFVAFNTDAEHRIANGNAAAGARSRKTSLHIEKLLKEWRKESVKKDG